MSAFTFSELSELQSTLTGTATAFASWRLPGAEAPETIAGSIEQVQQLDSIRQLNTLTSGYIFAPFEPGEPACLIQSQWYRRGFTFEPLSIEAANKKYPLPSKDIKSASKSEYMARVHDAIQHIKSGEISKVVLSRVVSHQLPNGFNPALLFKQLCINYPLAFVYLVYLPGKGLWAGATPELLAAISNGRIRTMALAATRKAGTVGQWTHKELMEQQWVSNYIKELFGSFGADGLQQSATYTSQAGPVEHLRTDFSATLSQDDAGAFLERLHPTPAVCGWPKNQALKVIAGLENYKREFYTGFTGPVNVGSQDTALFVNLRCLQIVDKYALIYVGGGITLESVPEDEWNETLLKSRTLLDAIEKC
ncbi:MAG: chorismate-binding protein [Lentimicrobiaceae bacterium]|nr:chorismate-binding protein [Lentimicrobiaceae bacterium]